ncbi:MAG: Smr/MutS family protein [Pseudomonadota bacterium]
MSRRAQHPFAAGDPRLDRLAGRGRLAIDAVLDLHGHSQRTARVALGRFLAAHHARGARCVLVITGKGSAAGARADSMEQGAGRGILRARFHDWLSEASLRDLISRASQAHPRHGGAGAFYVFLKR